MSDAFDNHADFAKREQPCRLFREALEVTDPMQRLHGARNALVRNKLSCGK